MEPFSSEELAAWLDGQYAEVQSRARGDYVLQPNEYTATTLAADQERPLSTMRRMLKVLREAGRIEARQEKIDRRWVWIYTIAKETE